MNATELARDKFNALFAAHDAKDTRAGTEDQKATLNAAKRKRRERRASASTDQKRGFDKMALRKKCKVNDDLVNQLIALNNKLNSLSTAFLHNPQARAEVQERRETLHVDLKQHRAKGHEGKPCPAARPLPYRSNLK